LRLSIETGLPGVVADLKELTGGDPDSEDEPRIPIYLDQIQKRYGPETLDHVEARSWFERIAEDKVSLRLRQENEKINRKNEEIKTRLKKTQIEYRDALREIQNFRLDEKPRLEGEISRLSDDCDGLRSRLANLEGELAAEKDKNAISIQDPAIPLRQVPKKQTPDPHHTTGNNDSSTVADEVLVVVIAGSIFLVLSMAFLLYCIVIESWTADSIFAFFIFLFGLSIIGNICWRKLTSLSRRIKSTFDEEKQGL
jgi:hypothetical protein